MKRESRVPVPAFPPAPVSYSQGNEQGFRRTVEQAFQMKPPPARVPIRIPYSAMIPVLHDEEYRMNSGYLSPVGTAVTRSFTASLVLPKGIEIVGFTTRTYRETSSDLVEVQLYQGDDTTGLAVELAETTHSTTGWLTASNAAALPTVTGDEIYSIALSLFSLSGTSANARFLWAEIDTVA